MQHSCQNSFAQFILQHQPHGRWTTYSHNTCRKITAIIIFTTKQAMSPGTIRDRYSPDTQSNILSISPYKYSHSHPYYINHIILGRAKHSAPFLHLSTTLPPARTHRHSTGAHVHAESLTGYSSDSLAFFWREASAAYMISVQMQQWRDFPSLRVFYKSILTEMTHTLRHLNVPPPNKKQIFSKKGASLFSSPSLTVVQT